MTAEGLDEPHEDFGRTGEQRNQQRRRDERMTDVSVTFSAGLNHRDINSLIVMYPETSYQSLSFLRTDSLVESKTGSNMAEASQQVDSSVVEELLKAEFPLIDLVMLTFSGNLVKLVYLSSLSEYCQNVTEKRAGGSVPSVEFGGAVPVDKQAEHRFQVDIKTIICEDPNGIGAICSHPTQRFFAVGGINRTTPRTDPTGGHHLVSSSPTIFVYKFPELVLHKQLEGGTENEFTCLSFSLSDPELENRGGDKLAAVGAGPDYCISVWDWQSEQVILKCKAFSQIVKNVKFNMNGGNIVTSGTGHIKFWRMKDTFTGLKLQGEIGKFGNVELSDITALEFLDDGKVLSGSESGSLLLWEGHLIKLEFRENKGLDPDDLTLPHSGEVLVIKRVQNVFVTCARDELVKFWDYHAVDDAEIPENRDFCILTGLRVLDLRAHPHCDLSKPIGCTNLQVVSLDVGESQSAQAFLVGTSIQGNWFAIRIDPKEDVCETGFCWLFKSFLSHGQEVCSTLVHNHRLISVAKDGTLRKTDLLTKEVVFAVDYLGTYQTYPSALSILKCGSLSSDPVPEEYLFVGRADGVLSWFPLLQLEPGVEGHRTNEQRTLQAPCCRFFDRNIKGIRIWQTVLLVYSDQALFFGIVEAPAEAGLKVKPCFSLDIQVFDILETDTGIMLLGTLGSSECETVLSWNLSKTIVSDVELLRTAGSFKIPFHQCFDLPGVRTWDARAWSQAVRERAQESNEKPNGNSKASLNGLRTESVNYGFLIGEVAAVLLVQDEMVELNMRCTTSQGESSPPEKLCSWDHEYIACHKAVGDVIFLGTIHGRIFAGRVGKNAFGCLSSFSILFQCSFHSDRISDLFSFQPTSGSKYKLVSCSVDGGINVIEIDRTSLSPPTPNQTVTFNVEALRVHGGSKTRQGVTRPGPAASIDQANHPTFLSLEEQEQRKESGRQEERAKLAQDVLMNRLEKVRSRYEVLKRCAAQLNLDNSELVLDSIVSNTCGFTIMFSIAYQRA